MKRSALVLFASLALGSFANAADAPYSLEARGAVVADDVRLPFCDDPGLFRYIASRFHGTERGYWHSDLRLESFEEPVEVGYRSWGLEFIPRRFCRTRALVSDGTVRDVHYAVIYKTGTLSVAHDIEWCVSGLDRSFAFAPGCKMAGP